MSWRVSPTVWIILAVSLLAGSPAWGQGASPAPAEELTIPFEKYQLPNGLEVILHVDHRLPLVAVNVWYHVGAYHETPGKSGFAHLFEHMMFQGSRDIAANQHIKVLEDAGASDWNGTTEFDRTNYFETLPRHQLETGLWLESDRMGFLLDAMNKAKLDTQREVVKNERRQGVETVPYGLAEEKLWKALFPGTHPYGGNVIGSMEDLTAASLDDVKSFFRAWYAPANATLCLAGDFDPAEAKKLVERYFGALPSLARPPLPKVEKVSLSQEVVIRHDEPVASLAKVYLAWHSPAIFTPGDEAADILQFILSEGHSSRLYKRLVHEKQLAQSADAHQQNLGAQSVFSVEVVARPGVTTEKLIQEVDAVLDEVRAGKVSADEVKRATNRMETKLLTGLQKLGGFGGKADQLQRYNHYLGDPGFLPKDVARYRKVTKDDVVRFAKEVLDPKRRVVVHAVPKPPAAGQEGK
jgi:predicted Zn-dependent peptidase